MKLAIHDLSAHYIICGLGRVGRGIGDLLASKGLAFVGIDSDLESIAYAESKGWKVIEGDATDDMTLQAAGLMRARGLAAVLGNDAENLFVVLSARLLSKDLDIIARASDDANAKKLTKAGANRVVSLLSAGAHRMAHLLMNTQVLDFAELISSEGEFDMTEIKLDAKSPFVGRTLSEVSAQKKDLMIFGLREKGGRLLIPPPTSAQLKSEDSLLAVGPAFAIEAFSSGQ